MDATETTPIARAANGSLSKTDHASDDISKTEHSRGYELLEKTDTPHAQDKQDRLEDVARGTLPARINNTETLMHLLKGMVGSGMLAMPVTFKNGGIWLTLGVAVALGVVCVHGMHLLVRCADEVSRRTGANHIDDYASVMEQTLEMREGLIKRRSGTGRIIVNALIITIQMGICCVLTVFVAQNVKQVVDHFSFHSPSDIIYIIIVSAALVPCVMLRTLKGIVPLSTLANILNVFGLGIIFYNIFQDMPSVSTRPAVGSFSTIPLMMAQSLYAFEGITLVLPLHHDMKDREAFLGNFGVLNIGLAITICVFIAIGFYGYLKYGDDIKGSITLNLSINSWYNITARLIFSASCMVMYLLMFYVPARIIWSFIEQQLVARGRTVHSFYNYLFRFFLVCIICGLSVSIPHLDLLIALTGAIASSFLTLIFPAMLEMMLFPPTPYLWTKDIIIILIGLYAFVVGTGYTMNAIIQTWRQ